MKNNIVKNSLALFLFVSICAGCSNKNPSEPDPNPLRYFSDMEQFTGFVEGAPVMLSTNAHSGKYVVKIDTANPYGIGFKRKLNEISLKKIMNVEVSAYINADAIPIGAALVCVVDNNDNVPIYYETFDLSKHISKAKEWTKVGATFYFPDTLKPEQRLIVYCFNPTNTSLFLDDFELNFSTK